MPASASGRSPLGHRLRRSPYQCFSAFADNPLLLSLDALKERGYLDSRDLESRPAFPASQVDFGAVIAWKLPLLRSDVPLVPAEFISRAVETSRLLRAHSSWLDEVALFMALKQADNNVAWKRWEPSRACASRMRSAHTNQLRDEIECHKFIQFEFEQQWRDLKAHCARNDIRIMGDVPIYVAFDSADVWANRELFELDESGRPKVVSGVPPDYFSATGQLWGNPSIAGKPMPSTGYAWWIARLRRALEMLDLIRLDHFRGFEAYYEIPGGDTTAVNGAWVKGPAPRCSKRWRTRSAVCPSSPKIWASSRPEWKPCASASVFPVWRSCNLPSAYDPQAPQFKPHNYPRHRVAYTGTHDNATTVGWWTSAAGAGSIRSSADVVEEMEYARRYLNTDGGEINWVMIRTLMASVADTVLFPCRMCWASAARPDEPARYVIGQLALALPPGQLTRRRARA